MPFRVSLVPSYKFSHASQSPVSSHRPTSCSSNRRRVPRLAVEPEKKMKVVAAYLLAVLGGNVQPSDKDLKSILGSVGAEVEDERLELLLSEVKGKDLAELIAAGREKLASVPSGGGAAAYSAPAASGGAVAAAPAAAEAKEEKKEEKEESDDDMGFSLFD